MSSAISGYINTIRNAVYGEQVRTAIINALEQCYSDVEDPSLQTEAFITAINAAYDSGILDITEVTLVSQMTNENIIYRYMGSETGYQANTLYYHNGTSWVPIGSAIRPVSTAAGMTDTSAIYKYTGSEDGYKANALYYYNGTSWALVGISSKFTATADGLVPHPTSKGTKKHFLGADGKWYYIAGASSSAANEESDDDEENTHIEWTEGYRKYLDGTPVTESVYYYSNKLYGNVSDVISSSSITAMQGDYRSYLSLFDSSGTFLGTYMYSSGKYYSPCLSPSSQYEVASITYSSFIININRNISSQITLQGDEGATGAIYGDFSTYTIGVLGDSITTQGGWADGFVTRLSNDFHTVYNYGVAGTLICDHAPTSYPPSFVSRYSEMINNLDIVIVFGGINDYYRATSFGTVDSTDTSTFYGALNVLVAGLATKYVDKEVVFITPLPAYYENHSTDANGASGHPLKDFRDAIIECCGRHGVQVLDLWSSSGMDIANSETAQDYYTTDGLHPNAKGHERIYRRLMNFLASTLR